MLACVREKIFGLVKRRGIFIWFSGVFGDRCFGDSFLAGLNFALKVRWLCSGEGRGEHVDARS